MKWKIVAMYLFEQKYDVTLCNKKMLVSLMDVNNKRKLEFAKNSQQFNVAGIVYWANVQTTSYLLLDPDAPT